MRVAETHETIGARLPRWGSRVRIPSSAPDGSCITPAFALRYRYVPDTHDGASTRHRSGLPAAPARIPPATRPAPTRAAAPAHLRHRGRWVAVAIRSSMGGLLPVASRAPPACPWSRPTGRDRWDGPVRTFRARV